ncbi:MAG: hypothetical protein E5X76_28925 [Mesorhizobium sp.]|nr:MAG: hypothetical protein E5X76_28925 [Mesorhizobium sp.]
MPKTVYIAIDPNGVEHTRTTDRIYTHIVVAQRSKAAALASANDKGWRATERSNYEYAQKIAAGDDPYPARTYMSADRFTAEQIAEEQARVDAENAKRLAQALADTSVTLERYHLDRLAERVARAEAGDYVSYVNHGWCGRHDLALKLAAKIGPSAVILPATAK